MLKKMTAKLTTTNFRLYFNLYQNFVNIFSTKYYTEQQMYASEYFTGKNFATCVKNP